MSRPALSNRLSESLDRGSLLLTAGTGFGKTTALEETLAARRDSVAWVRCSASAGDPGRLFELVLEALTRAAPGVADGLSERLAMGVQPIDLTLATGALGEEIDRLLVDPLTVVLDDGEGLVASREALALVDGLLAVRSPALRVAVASRLSLDVGGQRLRGAGRLSEAGPADLAFSLEECADVLRRVGRAEVDTATVEAVWEATEGWPIAVVLAALAPGRRPSADRGLSAFLDELIDPLPDQVKDDLADSSVAPDLDPEVLESLGLPPSLGDDVLALGLPSQWAVDGQGWSYHPLVRDFLRARLHRERDDAHRAGLHCRCAEALEAAGRGPEAVEQWLEGDAPERAAAAVAANGAVMARTAPATVSSWLERLPGEVRRTPALSLLEGRLDAGAGRLGTAVAPLQRAVEGFAAAGEQELAWLARLGLVDSLAIVEDFDAAIPLADGWEESSTPASAAVAVSVAASMAGARRYEEAVELFESVCAHPAGAPLEHFTRGFQGFWVDLQCGRLDAALAGLRRAVEHLQREDPFDRLPYVMGMEAVVLEERGEDERALEVFRRAREAAAEAMLGGYIDDIAHLFAAGVHARAGRLAEAEAELASAAGEGLGWYAGDREVTRATVAAAQGAAVEAAELADVAIAAGAMHPWRSRWRNTARLAPVLVAAGRADAASALVDDALADAPPAAGCARLRALRAWLTSLEGDDARWPGELAQAWEEAGPEAVHLVRRELPRIGQLLWQAVQRGALPPGEVVAAVAAADPSGSALADYAAHPLSAARRETATALAASGAPAALKWLSRLEADPDAEVAGTARACRSGVAGRPLPLVFRVLGGFSLSRASYRLREDDWAGRRPAAQRLVRYLLANRGSAVTEDDLFEAFWPDREASAARRSLQVTVSSARAALDPPGTDETVLVVADRTYRLELADGDVVDAAEFDSAAREALSAEGDRRLRLLEAAAVRWTGEPLPEDRYEPWATPWRERLIDLEREVLGALADARSAAGDLAGAVDAARSGVELDPRDEAAHRRLITLYSRTGRRGHALSQYAACRRALIDELGIEPSAETADLQRRALAGERL